VSDRVLWLIGSWECQSFANWPERQVYGYEDNRIVLRNLLHSPVGNFTIVQRFRFDFTSHRWATYVDGGDFSAHGPPWTGDRWILGGVWRGISGSARLVYLALGDNVFRRDFQVFKAGRWLTSSGDTCVRGQP
jgi:hypothetical protein